MGLVNSHIQITKALLKNFSHKTNGIKKVYYLDLHNLEIKEEKIKILGTEYGYYCEEIESFLSKEVESKIGDIVKLFKEFSHGRVQQMEIPPEQQERIKLFCRFSLIRSNYVLKIVNDTSVVARIIGGLSTNNIIPFYDSFDPFEGYISTVLVNKSNVEFVIPRNCVYSVTVKGKGPQYILPLTPKVAFLLIHSSELINHTFNGKYHYPVIIDDEIAIRCNKHALFTEKQYNNTFIVASREKELEKLLKFI
jgi:hypothetical protein